MIDSLFKKNLTYKDTHDVEQRISESNRILAKHPNLIPIIVSADDKIGPLKKNKFLCPADISFSQFLCSVRKQITLDSSQAIFAFCNGKIISSTSSMRSIYQEYMDSNNNGRERYDKFLYLTLELESTFGSI